MSADLDFDIPFSFDVNPDLDRARKRNRQWLAERGLMAGEAERVAHAGIDVERLVAYAYPRAQGADVDLAMRFGSFFLLYDDQFTYQLGRDPRAVAAVADQFAEVVRGRRPAAGAPKLVIALDEIWQDWCAGMSPVWCRRSAHHWEQYLVIPAHESALRARGTMPAEDCYLELRDISGFMYPILDLCDRVGGYELEPLVFHAPELSVLRHITVQVVSFANDVASVDKERRDGETGNLALLYEQRRGLSPREAVERVRALVNARVRRFLELEAELPGVCAALHLPDDQCRAVFRYVRDLRAWISGYCQWQRETLRYRPAGPGNFPRNEHHLIARS
jgi:avermitilol synthase